VGRDVEVLVALGLGRSYGSSSRLLIRTLPGILQSGLWPQLERSPPAPTRALVTDVGNDILYGFGAEQTLAWVEECLDRLQRFTREIVVTGLPLQGIRRLSRAKYFLFRAILVPQCRLSLGQVLDTAERVGTASGLAVSVRPWASSRGYGFDRSHPSACGAPHKEILCGEAAAPATSGSRPAALRLLRSVRLSWAWRRSPQPGVTLPSGGQVWLY
jgi:hypothetical protein